MKNYLQRITEAATLEEFKNILKEAENDKSITDSQYYYIKQKIIERISKEIKTL